MLFCFSAQQRDHDEYHLLVRDLADEDEEPDDSVEAHDNLINQELQLVSTGKSVDSSRGHQRSNHRRTLSSSGTDLGPIKSPVATPRTFRKSQSSTAVVLGAGAVTAVGKFVDPVAVVAADQAHQQLQHNQSATSISRTLARKLGPSASFLRRNLSQTFRSSKGIEHLQREALRKSNESAAGLSPDQSQRYIRLPSSNNNSQNNNSSSGATSNTSNSANNTASTPKSSSGSSQQTSSLTKSQTSAAIVAIGESRLQQHSSSHSPSPATSDFVGVTTGVAALSSTKSDPTAHRVHQHSHSHRHSSHSSPSSPSSPPPPTLVPRSANNPPPRPKTNKPCRTNSIHSNSSMSSRHQLQQQSSPPLVHNLASTLSASQSSQLDPLSQSSSSSSLHHSSSSSSIHCSSPLSTFASPCHSIATTTCTMTSTVTTTTTMSMMTPLASSTTNGITAASQSNNQQQGSSSSNGASSSSNSSGSQQQQQQQSASSANSSNSSSSHHHHQHQQFINKPPRGWLHPDHKLSDSVGVSYAVRVSSSLHPHIQAHMHNIWPRSVVDSFRESI